MSTGKNCWVRRDGRDVQITTLSNPQGHEDVERLRSERRCGIRPRRQALLNNRQIGRPGLQTDERRPLPQGDLFFLWSPLGRQVFVVVLSERRGRRAGGGGPGIIDLGRYQQE